jgi:outer membrane protein TolC
MKFMRIVIVFFCLSFIVQKTGYSQNKIPFDVLRDDLQTRLLPLNQLIDSAVTHDAYIRFRHQQLIVNSCKLTEERKSWTRNLGIQGDVLYGNYVSSYTNTGQVGIVPSYTTSQNETQYGVGAYVRLPVFDVIGRKNQIKLAKAEIDQAQSMAEMQIQELRQRVIHQYNDLIIKQRVLKIKSKYLATTKMNMQMAETGFVNGSIPVMEYARISEMEANTETDFENAKMDYLTTYMILEDMVGMKFNLSNDLQGRNEGN